MSDLNFSKPGPGWAWSSQYRPDQHFNVELRRQVQAPSAEHRVG
ncbi:hypothetical protein [Sorangium sp. So ce1000]